MCMRVREGALIFASMFYVCKHAFCTRVFYLWPRMETWRHVTWVDGDSESVFSFDCTVHAYIHAYIHTCTCMTKIKITHTMHMARKSLLQTKTRVYCQVIKLENRPVWRYSHVCCVCVCIHTYIHTYIRTKSKHKKRVLKEEHSWQTHLLGDTRSYVAYVVVHVSILCGGFCFELLRVSIRESVYTCILIAISFISCVHSACLVYKH
jgi:hypothetical protein